MDIGSSDAAYLCIVAHSQWVAGRGLPVAARTTPGGGAGTGRAAGDLPGPSAPEPEQQGIHGRRRGPDAGRREGRAGRAGPAGPGESPGGGRAEAAGRTGGRPRERTPGRPGLVSRPGVPDPNRARSTGRRGRIPDVARESVLAQRSGQPCSSRSQAYPGQYARTGRSARLSLGRQDPGARRAAQHEGRQEIRTARPG